MNTKIKAFLKTSSLSALGTFAFLSASHQDTQSSFTYELNWGFSSVLAQDDTAENADDEERHDAPDERHSLCHAAAQEYTHGALKFFNGQLCVLNVQFPGIAEQVLYKIFKMGLDPDLTALDDDGTATDLPEKTFRTKTITGTLQKVVSPDTFADAYDYRAEVKMDGDTFVVIYWSGSGESSKGFLIKGGEGFRNANEGLYIKWDRTTEEQSVQVLGARMGSGVYASDGQQDRSIFGEATFNTETSAVTVQMTEIGPKRAAESASTTPACWLMYGSGTKDGDIVMNKSHNDFSASGNSLASTVKDGSSGTMDRAEIVDDVDTENGTGNFTTASGVALKYSCADLNGAAGTGKPFEGNTVNFDMTKTQADAMFATQ